MLTKKVAKTMDAPELVKSTTKHSQPTSRRPQMRTESPFNDGPYYSTFKNSPMMPPLGEGGTFNENYGESPFSPINLRPKIGTCHAKPAHIRRHTSYYPPFSASFPPFPPPSQL
jgi:hypothetical protein